MNKLKLPNIMLIAMTSVNIEATVKALKYSSDLIEFGCVKLVSTTKPVNLPDNIEWEYIDNINNINEWSFNIIYNLPKYVNNTPSHITHIFLAHSDGFPVNPESWRDEFLDYDYIGAPWPIPNDNFSYRDRYGNLIRAGNSVSLRSKKLLNIANEQKLIWKPYYGYYNEDGFIAIHNRDIYIREGCKFADIDVAKYFSHEVHGNPNAIPEIIGIKPFAFHKWEGSNKNYPRF